ncbi:MAG: hypothetical protein ABSC20_10065 [Candidatus Bathyarchaeia archaeon]|jgi:hypothetical protein
MGDNEGLEEWNAMAKEIVGMYRAVWVLYVIQVQTAQNGAGTLILLHTIPFIQSNTN